MSGRDPRFVRVEICRHSHGVVYVFIACLAVCASCGPGTRTTDLAVAEFEHDAGGVQYDDRAWAAVLRENVVDGVVNYDHLAAHRLGLDEYLSMVGAVGPETHPDQFPAAAHRICYYVNAFNAGILAAALHSGVPDTVADVDNGRLQNRFRTRVDGRWVRLREIAERAIGEAGEETRVLFAMCDGAVGSPPLHGQPFRVDGLDETLRVIARKAMDNHRVVTVEHAQQALLVATWLAAHRGWLIGSYERRTGARDATLLNVLLEFASGARRDWLNTAVGYPIQLIPFDRRLNRRPAA